MYTNEDLTSAIDAGIFSQNKVEEFRTFVADSRNSPSEDEESFKLISGFNDIFVVIASILMLLSTSWVTYSISPIVSSMVVATFSWLLAEFFVRKRKLSLTAIVLLISFVASIFLGTTRLFPEVSENMFMLSALVSAFAAYLHWKRFTVPITVAAGISIIVVFLVSSIFYFIDNATRYAQYIVFFIGIMTFFIAMYWDSTDTKRLTNNSDVAFWLHLLSAPLIIHPVFSMLGVFDNAFTVPSLISIIILYILLSTISLIIDRRTFMVSSLVYVLYALNTLFSTYGIANNSLAMAGILIGLSLLLLSGYWAKTRSFLLKLLPENIRTKVPKAFHVSPSS